MILRIACHWLVAILILFWMSTCVQPQATYWHYPNTDKFPSFGFFDSASISDSSPELLGPAINNVPDAPVYGPQPYKECPINPRFLDPRLIKATNAEINDCSEKSAALCFFAHTSKYRTIDGSCNNIEHPSWGRSNICLRRVLPYDYGDKRSFPRISCTGRVLPNPRVISNEFHQEFQPKFNRLTTQFMEWGQVLAHDVSLNDIFRTQESGGNFPLPCCQNGPTVDDRCMSVAIPPNDPFYPKFGLSCLSMVRTLPCSCHSGQRQHSNQNTAYHDLSLVYGSTEEEARKLRSGHLGMLDISLSRKAGPLLPRVPVEELCVSRPSKSSCFRAGDSRSNQNPFLLTVHTMLLRYHNFLCQELHTINPHWDDEKLYQEARRIHIAQAQMITYGLYLPHVLGVVMDKEELTVLKGVHYTQYDPTLDASIADEYTTVAARYGHSLVPNVLSEIDPKTGAKDLIRLKDYFYRPFEFKKGQMDAIALGMTKDRKMKHDVFLGDDLRNFLYRRVYMNESTGGDLSAISIARGRDHGIPGYTYYVAHFFNFTIHSFEDLRKMLPGKTVDLLEQLFESVHDVDLYSAGLAEYYVQGGFVGPTFAALLGGQYKRMKYGDRYWFEHKNQAGSFAPEQLKEIKRTSFARIICETTAIEAIQRDVFLPPSSSNPVVPCEHIERFNIFLWKE